MAPLETWKIPSARVCSSLPLLPAITDSFTFLGVLGRLSVLTGCHSLAGAEHFVC